MDDVRVGAAFRALRIRRRLTQSQLADAAGTSRAVISQIERGGLEGTSLRIVRRVGVVLAISLQFDPRWRGVEMARLLDQGHVELVRAIVVRLTAMGWEPIPEHTFNEWGERGSIDVFAWKAARGAVLCLEVKTSLRDFQAMLSSEDRKRRLAPAIARKLGWRARVVGSVIVLPETKWARSAIAGNRPVIDARFPLRTLDLRRWLREPDRDVSGVWFLANAALGDARRHSAGSMRVRRPRQSGSATDPRSNRHARPAAAPRPTE